MAEKKERSNPFLKDNIGKPDIQSRPKAEKAADKADKEIKRVQSEPLASSNGVPLGVKGTPMIQAEMSAAELIPTGQYANVSVGPARIHFWIDTDRELAEGEDYFNAQQRATISQALNEAAELVEVDVIAVQRNLVLESLQNQGE